MTVWTCVALVANAVAVAWIFREFVAGLRRERYIAGLRKLISEHDEKLDFCVQRAYARGWNDRLNFGLPMNLARVKPPEERSN